MALNFSRISKELEAFGNEFIDALMTDISHPKFRSTIKDIVRNRVSSATGFNLNSAFLRPRFDSFYDDIEEYVLQNIGIVMSNPPESIDASAEVMKEVVTEKIDSFADRIKAKMKSKEVKDATVDITSVSEERGYQKPVISIPSSSQSSYFF